MKYLVAFTLVVGFGVLASNGPAAPALGDKPPRWEYAELKFSRVLRAPLAIGVAGAAPVPAPAAPAAAQSTIRFSSAEEEVDATEWEDLANKLKAPPPKKEGSPTLHKLRVLNRLGADGWEIITHTGSDGTTGTANWTFKRRVP